MSRYVLITSNANAGGGANQARTTFHISSTFDTDQVAAQLLGFAQYMLPSSGTQVDEISYAAGDAPGPMLPLGFPTAKYAALRTHDSNLAAMTAYATAYGTGDLTALGVGAVLDKRTATPGRSGRGRLTTPWLNTDSVTAEGVLLSTQAAVLLTGWDDYLRGGNVGGVDLFPYIYDKAGVQHAIVSVTVTTRLGRLRSRSR
jgi:hypothetical protein